MYTQLPGPGREVTDRTPSAPSIHSFSSARQSRAQCRARELSCKILLVEARLITMHDAACTAPHTGRGVWCPDDVRVSFSTKTHTPKSAPSSSHPRTTRLFGEPTQPRDKIFARGEPRALALGGSCTKPRLGVDRVTPILATQRGQRISTSREVAFCV